MSDDAWPMPISPFEMRRHLGDTHHLTLWGTAWTEMVAIHDRAHLADVGHTHEAPR